MKDLIFDDDEDILILNGDFDISDSTIQHQFDLLKSAPGDWLFAPEIGVNVESFLDSETNVNDLFRRIKFEFDRDGMQVDSIQIAKNDFYSGIITSDTIRINAYYQ
jgi:hypothetical protein